jgi:hypothetical protein
VINKALFGHFSIGDEEEKNDLESQYVEKFNEVGKLTEQKNIKFFSAIGDPYITTAETADINNERKDFMDQFLFTLKDEGIHRYNLKTDVDQPKSDIILPDYLATWDLNKNDPTKKRRLVIFINKKF